MRHHPRWAYDYCLTLQRRFHPSSPVYDAFRPIREALRQAAYAVTLDTHFFGIGRGGQTVMPPPPAPPIPGIVREPLTNLNRSTRPEARMAIRKVGLRTLFSVPLRRRSVRRSWALADFHLAVRSVVDEPIVPQEGPPEDHFMPLTALAKLHTREALEQEPVQARHIQAGHVRRCEMTAADAADVAFLVDYQAEFLRQVVVDAVAAGACVDQGAQALRWQVGLAVAVKGASQADVHPERRPKLGEKVGRKLAVLAPAKPGLGQGYEPG